MNAVSDRSLNGNIEGEGWGEVWLGWGKGALEDGKSNPSSKGCDVLGAVGRARFSSSLSAKWQM